MATESHQRTSRHASDGIIDDLHLREMSSYYKTRVIKRDKVGAGESCIKFKLVTILLAYK